MSGGPGTSFPTGKIQMSTERRSRDADRALVNRAAAGLSALVLAALAAPAHADTCSVEATALDFGSVSGGAVSATGTITVSCNGNGLEPFSLALSPGSGTFPNRTMRRDGEALAYNVYTDAAHTQIWGDGAGGTATVSGVLDLNSPGKHTITETAFGLIPSQVLPSSGAYADTLVITLTF